MFRENTDAFLCKYFTKIWGSAKKNSSGEFPVDPAAQNTQELLRIIKNWNVMWEIVSRMANYKIFRLDISVIARIYNRSSKSLRSTLLIHLWWSLVTKSPFWTRNLCKTTFAAPHRGRGTPQKRFPGKWDRYLPSSNFFISRSWPIRDLKEVEMRYIQLHTITYALHTPSEASQSSTGKVFVFWKVWWDQFLCCVGNHQVFVFNKTAHRQISGAEDVTYKLHTSYIRKTYAFGLCFLGILCKSTKKLSSQVLSSDNLHTYPVNSHQRSCTS